MGFKKEEAYRYALCMDLTPNKFQYSIVDPKLKEVVESKSFDLTEFSKAIVKEHLQDDVLSGNFASYTLSSGSIRNTLIPTDLFSHTSPASTFKLNYPEPIDNLDYNRIAELGIVNIYELPIWVKSLFVISFPRIKIIHRSTVLLKGIFDGSTYRPKIHAFIEGEQFYLFLTDKSKLIYFNRFDYKELADLVYYILFVLEQKELDQANFEILLYGLASDWSDKSKFQSFFSAPVKIADKPANGKDFMLAKQLLCV